MIKNNYHTHTYLCNHATGTIEDYVKVAVSQNMSELGMSDHGPITRNLKRMNKDQLYNLYLPKINEAIMKYGNQIKIYKALELEYINGMDDDYKEYLKVLDYLILGQHLLEIEGQDYSIYEIISEREVNAYKDTIIRGLNSGYFKILAHPELFYSKYQKWDITAISASKAIIEAAIANNCYLEFNVSGIKKAKYTKDYNNWPYPRKEFWELVKEYKDAKIIIGIDAHAPNQINDEAVEIGLNFINEIGLNVIERIDFNE